jgi:hypothetical protein
MMFARIENGSCAAYPVDPYAENPTTSFALDWSGGVVNGVEYASVVPVDVPQVPYTQNFAEGVPALINGVWTQTWVVTDATPEQIAARTDDQSSMVRLDRNSRLTACDWTQLPDVSVDVQAWAEYRQELRDITDQVGFPWDVDWPLTPDEAAP